MKPNILIVYTDQQRFDTLGCNGQPLIRTPQLDALAAEGANLQGCHVSCPICVPSRVAMWTGQWGLRSGSVDNGRASHLRDGLPDLARHLKSEGYTTALIGKDHCFAQAMLDTCFDHSALANHLSVDRPRNADEQTMVEGRAGTMQLPMADEPTPAAASITSWCADHAVEYLDRDHDQPFCCWLSIPDPHPPYMVCEPYASMYDQIDIPGPVWREGEMDDKPARHRIAVELDRLGLQYPSEEDILRLRRIYWGMVSQIDDAVGRVLSTLAQRGLERDTIVLFTSDHGDYMGDHRLIRKGVDCSAAICHVPMLWRWPGEIGTQTSEALVSNVDIFPTLCELAGLPIPASVQGESCAPLLRGERNEHRERVFSHHGRQDEPMLVMPEERRAELMADPNMNPILGSDFYAGRVLSVRDRCWHYSYTPGDVDELYDRHADPHELHNLAARPEHAATVAELRAALLDWVSDCTTG